MYAFVSSVGYPAQEERPQREETGFDPRRGSGFTLNPPPKSNITDVIIGNTIPLFVLAGERTTPAPFDN